MRTFDIVRALQMNDSTALEKALKITSDEEKECLNQLNNSSFGASSPGTRLAKIILGRLNEHIFATNNQGKFSSMPATLQLEHVLPQKYDTVTEWAEIWCASDASLWMHRLGNIALLNQKTNAKISNGAFNCKRGYLNDSPYPLTRVISNYQTWDAQAVGTQHTRIIDLATEVWRLVI